jgi:NAD(P)H-dependent FMN reductase
LLAASPGSLGGLRGLVAVRSILGNIRVLVIPDQIAVPAAHEAFDQTGALIDAKRAAAVEALGGKVAAMVTKLTA